VSAPGIVIAAPASGSGKTVVTLGLLRRLRGEGVAVASCKVGPDYIDPRFHEEASGRPCPNLDPWAMRPGTLARIAQAAADGADLLVVEGVMGLFDGAADGTGSTGEPAGTPLFALADARGPALGPAGAQAGPVRGSFLHVIDRAG
jgi:cobyrinic acid a,c-diamide synthase